MRVLSKIKILILPTTVLIVSFLCTPAQAKQNDSIKILTNLVIDNIRESTIKKADLLFNEKPVTVTAASCKRSSGGLHDFYSEGDYWWPDPANPTGKFIRKDGQTNPDIFSDHRFAMIRFSEITATLTSAWLLTGNKKYANKAIEHINAWTVDTATKMNPNMLYGQAIWGRYTGRGIGLIDAYHLVEVARSVKVLSDNGAISINNLKKIKAWFGEFLQWMTTHKYGIDEMNHPNNHSVCWTATASSFAVLTDNKDKIEFCRNRFKNFLLPKQMSEIGSFPNELSRTKPYGYSLFVSDAIFNVAQILSTTDNNLFEYVAENGRNLKKGIEFIFPYIKDKSKWPFAKDIYIWDEWPVRQSSLLFSGMAYKNKSYIKTYLSLPDNPTHTEVIRNLPVRHPAIWLLTEISKQ